MKRITIILIYVVSLIGAPTYAMTGADKRAFHLLKDYLRVTEVFPDEGESFLQAIEREQGLSPEFVEAALNLIIGDRQWKSFDEPIDRVLEILPKIRKSNLFHGLPHSDLGNRIKSRLHFVRLRQRADIALKISNSLGLWDESDLPLLVRKTTPENNFEYLDGLLSIPPNLISIRSREILTEATAGQQHLFYQALAYHFDIPTNLRDLIRNYILLYANWPSAERESFPISSNIELSWLYSRVLKDLHVRWLAQDPQVMEATTAARRSLLLNLRARLVMDGFFQRFEGPGFDLPPIQVDEEWKGATGGEIISLDKYRQKSCEDDLEN